MENQIEADITFIDPVCKMAITAQESKGKRHFEGKEYLFCSLDCEEQFIDNPGGYLPGYAGASKRAEEIKPAKPRTLLGVLWRKIATMVRPSDQ